MPDSFPVAGAQIKVNGTELSKELMSQLLDLEVRDNLLKPDTAVFRLRDPEGTIIDNPSLKVGAELEIKMAAAEDVTVAPLFKGEIAVLEPEFTEKDCIVAVRAYDRGHRLNRRRASQTFQNVSASDMVRKIGTAAGLTPGTLDSSPVYEFFQQSMETDWDFCWRVAAMHNFEFVVQDRTFHFRRRQKGPVAATLTWGDNLLGFRPRLSGVGQPSGVTVGGHNPKARQQVTGQATTPALASTTPAANGRASTVGTLQGGMVVVADRVVDGQSEANSLAQNTLDRLASTFVEAEGKALGDPNLRAGVTVKIDKVGQQFSGEYVLTQTRHSLRSGHGYTTSFVISGRTDHTFTELLQRPEQDSWSSSLVIGVVTNNNDPDKLGRVRVKFPALGADIEGWWARVATINAGNERGLFMMPEINDEVVVAFEHGDTRRPIVIGSLYHGKAKLPKDLMDPTNKPAKARFGVKSDESVFVEAQKEMTLRSKEKMLVEVFGNPGDYTLDAKGKVEQKGQSVKTTSKSTIEVEANQSVTVKGISITVEASAALTLKGATIDIQASGPVNVKGAMINLG